MMTPTHCALWREPETVLAEPRKERFELLETRIESSHHWRYVLKCRFCGQLYFYEFVEEIDWQGGDDPSYVTWIPFAGAEQRARLDRASDLSGLRDISPRLQVDWPKVGSKRIVWVGEEHR